MISILLLSTLALATNAQKYAIGTVYSDTNCSNVALVESFTPNACYSSGTLCAAKQLPQDVCGLIGSLYFAKVKCGSTLSLDIFMDNKCSNSLNMTVPAVTPNTCLSINQIKGSFQFKCSDTPSGDVIAPPTITNINGEVDNRGIIALGIFALLATLF